MTRANPLVMDGSEVKLRLMAERTAHKTPVHVDWVRFTCLLRNAPAPSVELLFPETISAWDANYRKALQQKVLREIPDADWVPSAQALDLANEVAKALGSEFTVNPELRKGHDFYKFRWSIDRNGSECGWVGFLASGDSPKQKAQAFTIHANIYGAACTFADHGWNERIADIVEAHDAKLTRADLALDFFEGMPGGMEKVKADYEAGLCNSNGKRLKPNMIGDWTANPRDGRSFYMGSKEAGKQTNVYEKGHQLFGFDAGSAWMRIELRYGNKLRVLPADMLRRPADFFAGASDWHRSCLDLADQVVAPEPVKTKAHLAVQTIEAECSRALRWAIQTAGPSLAMLVKHATFEQLFEVTENKALPGRMQKFTETEIASGFRRAMSLFTTAESTGPALMAA